jgi:hypothetical protein
MQAAGFPDHDVDALYRHFSDFDNYFCEAAGERAFLVVAPAFADWMTGMRFSGWR